MVKKTLLFSAIAATFAALTNNVLADDSNVVVLDQANFDKEVMKQDLMLVEFYAPWCGHCKALAPEYDSAATTLKEDDIKLGKVDCTVNQDLCQEYEVRGYPTIKVFRNGETADYKGARKADGIVSYMQKQAAPAVTDLDADNFAKFKESDRVVVVAYTSPSDEKSKAAVKEVAEKLRDDYFFGLVTDEALIKEQNVEKLPSVVIYKQFDQELDGGRSDWTESLEDSEKVQEFIKTNSVPLLDEIQASNFASYAEAGLPLAYIFADSKEMAEPLVEAVKPIAQKYKGKINFVHIDAKKYGPHAGNVGLKQEWPAFAIQHIDSGAKFPYDQSAEITTKNIEQFVADYAAGKIEPTLKSEDIPADNDGPVKVVVAKQFNEVVLDKSKDAFLEVYAPWCGHCKRLAPIWEELGQAVEKQGLKDKVVIAKMDGTENDVPPEAGFTVSGFPTLKFFKAETNELLDYNGGRSLEDLVEFLNENGSNGVKLSIAKDADAESQEEQEDSGHDEL
ncbi:thioredoxin-like protein [Zychaea mexicana]|uniref:thioredoxin-like protein n=1 Tax=Zychaea mexicana TaxID=64656 RepID=UPI0022FE5E79|nr:thioredoxin-like protein [Zychaea mexicana]KAI9484602.1 thioredoxin-like protein [Zychaea mexicana]